MMTFGPGLEIRSWNTALEQLTGISAAAAVGRPCWEMLGGVDDAGMVCHTSCSQMRLAREGWPIPSRQLSIKTTQGRRAVSMSTIIASDSVTGPVCLHVFRDGVVEHDVQEEVELHLTPRQREVLGLLTAGVPAKSIAQELGVAEVTVRNHIRAILVELGCHSQLTAVAEARRRGAIQ